MLLAIGCFSPKFALTWQLVVFGVRRALQIFSTCPCMIEKSTTLIARTLGTCITTFTHISHDAEFTVPCIWTWIFVAGEVSAQDFFDIIHNIFFNILVNIFTCWSCSYRCYEDKCDCSPHDRLISCVVLSSCTREQNDP
uniref:U112-Liphistoxin-Lsp1a_1 n=2 Tax=Liphistius TaxID=62150 RepID=A0A4Q8K6I3_9ARAC